MVGSISRRNVPRVPKTPEFSSNFRNESISEDMENDPVNKILQEAVPKSAGSIKAVPEKQIHRKETSVGSVSIMADSENIGKFTISTKY